MYGHGGNMTNGRFPPTKPLSRARDLRSVAPFLRDLEALCRRRGFVLEANSAGLIVADMSQADLPGHYKSAYRSPAERGNFTAICWRPGRIR